eukprot:6593192-Ditylum_brightwellii.AAC.1
MDNLLEELFSKGHEVIFALDANEGLEEDGPFKELCKKHNLLDMHQHFHSGKVPPSTYTRGRTFFITFLYPHASYQ